MTHHSGLICRRVLWGGSPYRVLSASDDLDDGVITVVERHVEHFLKFPSSSFVKHLREQNAAWYYQVVGENLRSLTRFFVRITNRPEFQAHTILFRDDQFSRLCQRSVTLLLQALGNSFPSLDQPEEVIAIPPISRTRLPLPGDGTFEILDALLRGQQVVAVGLSMEMLDALMVLLPDRLAEGFVIAYGAGSAVVESNLLIPCQAFSVAGEASLPVPTLKLKNPQAWMSRIQTCLSQSTGVILVESLEQLHLLQPDIDCDHNMLDLHSLNDQSTSTRGRSGRISSIKESVRRYWRSR